MTGIEQVGDPGAPHVAWFVHGILGRGRNFRSFARRLTAQFPAFRALLPDLRCHGEAAPQTAPHDLAACARDLEVLAKEHGRPCVIAGHSFGGKVAALWAAEHAPESAALWVLDSPPSAVTSRAATAALGDPVRVLEILRAIPVPAESRDVLRRALSEAHLPQGVVDWLLTSAVQRANRWQWLWDLDGVQSMLQSYAEADLWPALYAMRDRPNGPEVHIVRAGRSDRWSARDIDHLATFAQQDRGFVHLLPNAGHWLHVDDPDETHALLAESFSRRAH